MVILNKKQFSHTIYNPAQFIRKENNYISYTVLKNQTHKSHLKNTHPVSVFKLQRFSSKTTKNLLQLITNKNNLYNLLSTRQKYNNMNNDLEESIFSV